MVELKVVFLGTPGWYLHVKNGVAIAENKSQNVKIELSAATCDTVIISTSRASFTSALVRNLASQGIDLVFLDRYGNPVGRLWSPLVNKTVATRRAQYEAMISGKGLRAATRIVICKLRNQAAVLRYFAKSRRMPELRDESYVIDGIADELQSKLEAQEKLDPSEILEVEAWAARRYWSNIAAYLVPEEFGFTGRKQESTDPLNLALNYGYGILRAAVERALILVGLDPYGGFLHAEKSGKETLVFDFMEQFRPVAVDRPLIANLSRMKLEVIRGFLSYESRRQVAAVVLETFNTPHVYGKRKRLLHEIIREEAARLASYLRGSRPEYEGYRAWW